MKRILISAVFQDNSQFVDFLSRFAHHFQYHSDIHLIIFHDHLFSTNHINLKEKPDSLCPPDLDFFLAKNNVKLIFKLVRDDISSVVASIAPCAIGLIYDQDFFSKTHTYLKKIVQKKFYYCDPLKTRQEGSNFIQASLDLIASHDKQFNEDESIRKFISLKSSIEDKTFESATIFATGPSVEKYKDYDHSRSLNIYCNSTILNEQLVKVAPPKVLTFADPIFHFGVSEYADSFRQSCRFFLTQNPNCFVVIPFKYYALAVSLFPDFANRIIGIPFTREKPINFEISADHFYTYTTSNILTLSLLPIATTFSKNVNLIGCDGREVSEDSYFWGHGNSVQINDKMVAIKKAHPGFFNIDYNEYYFEHCHNLSRMMILAEEKKWTFKHLGPSYIPALKSRSTVDSSIKSTSKDNSEAFVLIEPDGIEKGDGHYEIWHRLLEREAKVKGYATYIWHSKKSNIYNHQTDIPTFDKHSWWVGFYEKKSLQEMIESTPTFSLFVDNLKHSLAAVLAERSFDCIHLYMYYGSVHHLKALLEFKKYVEGEHNVKLRIYCTLSFEAIRFDPKRSKFWGDRFGHFKNILLESQYYFPDVKVFAMTERFATYMLDKYDILLPVLIHPILKEKAQVSPSLLQGSGKHYAAKLKKLLLPCRYTLGKCPPNYFDLVRQILDSCPVKISIRDSVDFSKDVNKLLSQYKDRVEVLPAEMTNQQFNHAFSVTDIVLIPYLAENFLMRSSGILTDAVMNLKPVVCFGHSTLSDIVEDHRIGIYCSTVTGDSISSAINRVAQNCELYHSSLLKYREFLKTAATFERQLTECVSERPKLVLPQRKF